MTRISKRTREQAIEICEQRYMSEFHAIGYVSPGAIAKDLDANLTALDLSLDAWLAVPGDDWLEASGLLRDGWCPGDPVVRL